MDTTIDMSQVETRLVHLEPITERNYRSYLVRLNIQDGEKCSDIARRVKRIPVVNSRRAISIALRSMFPELKPYLKIEKALPKVYDLTHVPDGLHKDDGSERFVPMLLMAYGGLRVGEALCITTADLTGNVLTVSKARNAEGVTKATKGNAGAVVLPSWVADRVSTYQGTSQYPNSYYRWLKRNTGLSPHQLRHWYATQLIKSGTNLEIVRKQLRHANLSTTLQTYAQVESMDIENDIEKVFG